VRASTAAPTFFTPVSWEGGLYCDGAITANNPAAIAVQEARALYPNTDIELLLSLGTGAYRVDDTGVRNMDWGILVNQIIASATGGDDVDSVLSDFLRPNQYFRFNPQIRENIGIDTKDKDVLALLKKYGRECVDELARTEPARFDELIKALRKSN